MAFKRTFTDPIPAKQAHRYAELGVDALHGVARFAGPDTIVVEGRTLRARHILIASGARPVPLGIPGEDLVSTSDAFLELQALPRRIVLIGGGYVAAEFSHLAARAGAEVTILQRAERLLPHFDPDLVGWLTERSPEQLDPLFRPAYGAAVGEGQHLRVVLDQVSSLTDTSALAMHARLGAG